MDKRKANKSTEESKKTGWAEFRDAHWEKLKKIDWKKFGKTNLEKLKKIDWKKLKNTSLEKLKKINWAEIKTSWKQLKKIDWAEIKTNSLKKLKEAGPAFRANIKTYQYQLSQAEWLLQLREASRFGARGTTMLAGFFINLLSLAFPLMLMQVYDRVIPNHSFTTLTLLATGVGIAMLLEMILRIMRSYVNLWGDTKFENALSKKAFAKLIDAPLPLYEKEGAGKRLKQLNTLDQMKGFYNNQLFTAVTDVPFVGIFLFVIAYIAGWLFLVPLLMLVALSVFSYYFLEYWEPTLNEKIAHEARENNFVVDVLNNIHTVKSMAMEPLLIRRYERLQLTGMAVNYKSSSEAGDLITIKTISSQLIIVLMVIFGALYVMNGLLAVGGLAACTLLVGRVMQPMNRALTAFNRWKTVNVVRQELENVLNLPVEDKSTLPLFGELIGNIDLKDVSYRYNENTPWILKNIHLTIPVRSMIGITGHEQSGKTTLMSMLATLLLPTTGEYLLDDKNIANYQLNDVRKEIAYLSQAGELFRGTIMDNLSAFDPEHEDAAQHLTQMLGLNEVIAKLPNGFDTLVGDRAVESLPRGVVNRMIIVRALSQKPKLVLFDEANMNFDVASNEKLMDLLKTLQEVATIIILSQRPETLSIAQTVYELKDGYLTKVTHAAK